MEAVKSVAYATLGKLALQENFEKNM